MTPRRNATTLTLLLAAALSIAAAYASTASAAVWRIEGKTLSELGLSEESITSSGNPMTIEVPKLGLKVECELEKGTGKIFSASTDEATMELSKCKVVGSKFCTAEPVTLKVKTELTKKAGTVYDLLKPSTGEILGTLTLKGESCPFPPKLNLTGITAGQLGLEEAAKQGLTFSKAIAEAAGTSMLAGANPAFLIGTSNRELSGAKNKGKKWGVCALCGLYSFGAEEGYGASNPAEPNVVRSIAGAGINLGSGNLFEAQSDLAALGRGPALQLTRYYNSQLAAAAKSPGAFGYGWTSTYSASLTVNEKAETATVRNDNGSTVVFYLIGSGYTPAPWVQAKLAKEGANYIYTLPNQLKLQFNSSGQLTKETDRHGNAITLAYNAKSQLETATDAAGRSLTFTYNAGGQVESVKDPMGHLSKYTYESSNLTAVTLPEESLRWKFGYDASHQLTSLTDARNNTTTFEYEASNRVKLEKDPMKRERLLEYKGTETKVTEPNASTTVEQFNSAFEPTAVTLASGTSIAAKTSSEYDSSFNLTAVTDPASHTTKYGYDAEGNVTSEKDANENETKLTYDSTHDVLTVTTPKKETTTITRNAAGDPEVIKRPAPGETTQETKFKWAENGDLEEEIDPLEHKTTFKYNKYGNLESETDAEEDKRTWSYDEDGQEIAEVSPRGNAIGETPSEYETKIKRDAQGRPEIVTDPLTHEVKYKYDGDGNLEVLTNPNGHAIKYVYDADNERTEVIAANGNTKKTTYDSEGNVESRTDGNEHTTHYEYNSLNQLAKTIDPLERKTTRKYNTAGDLKELEDAKGRITTYTYDSGDRLKEVSYSDGTTHAVSYEYGQDDEVTVMKDATGTSKYTYDELDRMTESVNGAGEVLKYKYNLGDQATEVTYPNKSSITRSFDKTGRLEAVKDWLGKETKFSYNRDSEVTATTFPAASEDKDEYAYDHAGRPEKTTMKRGAASLASLIYAHDNAGLLKSETQTGLPGIEKPEYGYDEKERMTSGAGASFKYDPANNPTEVAGAAQEFDEASQLSKSGTTKYAYDEVGERIKAEPSGGTTTTYGYDQAGHLISVTKPGSIEDTYAYDGNGLRASQTVKGTTTHMAWDTAESPPLLLYDGVNYYIYGPDGLPFEQINSKGEATYLHHDAQGSTRLLTNASGETKGTYTYTPYGAVETHTGEATTPLGYDGQYTNEDTGLIYLRARAYDPSTAQFLSVDPKAAQTGAPYSYAADNPVNLGDPTGEDTYGYCWNALTISGRPASVTGAICLVIDRQGGAAITWGVSGTGAIDRAALRQAIDQIRRNPRELISSLSASTALAYQSSNAASVEELSGPFASAQGTVSIPYWRGSITANYEHFIGGNVRGDTYSLGVSTSGFTYNIGVGASTTLVTPFEAGSVGSRLITTTVNSLNRVNILWWLGL